jgi:glutathione S-transferase
MYPRDREDRMKLHWSPRSPFVRKVMVLLHETGLTDKVDLVRSVVAMHATNAELMRDNPLNKLPTLVLDDGSALFDSPVVCEYLDTQHGGARMFPANGPARFAALRWQALGDGLLDLLVLWRNELNRPQDVQSKPHRAAFEAKAEAALDRLEAEAATLEATPFGIGHIAVGCALSYVDFRFPERDWRAGRPAITAWHNAFAARPSVVATEPVDE